MTTKQSWLSLHQLLQAEQKQATDSAVSCDDLDRFQQGLGQAWLDAIAPQENDKLSRRFAWSGLDVATLRRVLARASEPEEAAVSEPWWDELKALQSALRSDPDRALQPWPLRTQMHSSFHFKTSGSCCRRCCGKAARQLSDLQTRSFNDGVFLALGQSLQADSVSEQVLQQFSLLRLLV